jgi:hypothetical protein
MWHKTECDSNSVNQNCKLLRALISFGGQIFIILLSIPSKKEKQILIYLSVCT